MAGDAVEGRSLSINLMSFVFIFIRLVPHQNFIFRKDNLCKSKISLSRDYIKIYSFKGGRRKVRERHPTVLRRSTNRIRRCPKQN